MSNNHIAPDLAVETSCSRRSHPSEDQKRFARRSPAWVGAAVAVHWRAAKGGAARRVLGAPYQVPLTQGPGDPDRRQVLVTTR